jgi:hypothetical protein
MQPYLGFPRHGLLGRHVGEIAQKQEADETLSGLRQSVTDRLFDEVAEMSLDNFIVRPKRRFVEKFQAKNAWEQLGHESRRLNRYNIGPAGITLAE